ncbi:MAG: DNA-binding protein [Bryobacteraceae bacterium]|nr:DNA-binding protein [Bryobacteraceae bacterium]
MKLKTPKQVFPDIIPVSYQSGMCMVREKHLPSVRIGRRVFIDVDELEAFAKNGGKALPGGWRREPK